MLTIWGRPNSHNVKKVVWLAEEIGLAYVRHDTAGKFGFPENYREMNPNMLVPTIEDDGLVLWESNAILRYLAGRYAPQLWPDNPAVRAIGDKWMDWQFSYATAQFDAFVNLVRRPAEQRDLDAVARSAAASAERMAIVEEALARHPWLSGDAFGIGDIPMGVYVHSWFSLDIPKPELPRVADWYARLAERPGYARHVKIALS
ncbi:glutathione S-transferase family protein [Flavisphingomonas formosensis]|uniref:glutathione S-transferase family protein n=1 Tax=Flavisphingomonas formosensis TaxID=861534 RepID=UPI0012F87A6F|nr:glutathione S-transferase family protein [Sphingomonas formosensis]